MENKSKKVILKFEKVCNQSSGEIVRRLIGFVKAQYLVDLIEVADLHDNRQANPRAPTKGNVTEEIRESLEGDKDLFPFKTKGILLAVSSPPRELERKRYELTFFDHETEGILDGGHNILAIGLYILEMATNNDKEIKRIKSWIELKNIWKEYKETILEIRQSLDVEVPIEILIPANDSEEVTNQFKKSIYEICMARNNNAELKAETKAHAAGHYEEIKEIIDEKLQEQVIWKAGTEGRIDVRNLISLAWISLLELNLPDGIPKITPVHTYSSKARCVKVLDEIMKHDDGKYVSHNREFHSALKLLRDLPRLYDLIYEKLPSAYNEAGGKFNTISVVQRDRRKKLTPFYENEIEDNVPDGYIAPLIYGLSALMVVVDGEIKWKIHDVDKFVVENLPKVLKQYKNIIELCGYDPQKVGKTPVSYDVVKEKFENCLPS